MITEPKRNKYVGHRYVPLIMDEWNKEQSYEGLSIVTYEGASYTSKKRVPVGIDILNTEYWVVTGNYNAQVESYRKDVRDMETRVNDSLDTVETRVNDSLSTIESEIKQIVEFNFLTEHVEGEDPADTVDRIISMGVNKGATTIEIYFPSGFYDFHKRIVNNVQGIVIIFKGKNRENTRILSRVPSGTFIENNTPNDLKFEDIHVTGYTTEDVDYFRPSTIGIRSLGNVILNNTLLQGFETLLEWSGGYYHRIKGSRLEKAKYIVRRGNANNYVFDDCRILRFDTFFSASSGAGPLVVTNSSIEQWTTSIFATADGARPHVIMTGSYIENYPEVEAGRGLAKPYYMGGTIGSGFGSYTFLGNMMSLRGVSRLINNSDVDTKNITSLGNQINYNDDLNTLYVFSNLESANINDFTFRVGGTKTPNFLSGSMSNPENCILHNPFTGKDETQLSFKTFDKSSAGFTLEANSSHVIEFTDLTGIKAGDLVEVIPLDFVQPRSFYQIMSVKDEIVTVKVFNVGSTTLTFGTMNWKIYHHRR